MDTNLVRPNPGERTITITNLTVSDAEFYAAVTSRPEAHRKQAVLDIIVIGSAAFQRIQSAVDVDFVEKRFGQLVGNFERALSQFEKQAHAALTKQLSPTESGSYTKHIGELIASARRDVQGWTGELTKATKDLLDPDKKSSGVGRLEQIIEEASAQFEAMFDPDIKDSYASRLHGQLASLFGEGSKPGTFDGSIQKALEPLLRELRDLKEKIEVRKAAEAVIAKSALKGQPFEDEIQERLSQLAQPFGDDVQAVGLGAGGTRAGDFLITLNGSGRRIVIEARNRRQLSLPAIKAEMDRQRSEREAEIAVYVSSSPDMLPQHVGDFQVYDDDKLVTTVRNFHIGYRMARLLAAARAPDGAADLVSLRSVLGKVRDAARSLRNVKTKASQVEKLADGIRTDAEGTEDTILNLIAEGERLIELPSAA